MLDHVAAREQRHFHVYKGPLLVLILEDRPGTLHSRATPGTSGPPEHAFVHGIARDALSEDELGKLLRESSSFDEYVQRLIANAYDIVSSDEDPDVQRLDGFRIVDAAGPVGALWPQSGQFSVLNWQPAPGQLVFQQCTLTVYKPEYAETLLALLQGAADFSMVCRGIEERGFRLKAITGRE